MFNKNNFNLLFLNRKWRWKFLVTVESLQHKLMHESSCYSDTEIYLFLRIQIGKLKIKITQASLFNSFSIIDDFSVVLFTETSDEFWLALVWLCRVVDPCAGGGGISPIISTYNNRIIPPSVSISKHGELSC